jgi:type I restriction enzyme M protein
MAEAFPDGNYRDMPGLCKVATRKDIEAQDWSLNPGRYVGVAPGQPHDDGEFKEKLETMQEELEGLNSQAAQLQECISQNVVKLLEIGKQ